MYIRIEVLNPRNICVRVFPKENSDTAVSDVIRQLAALLITLSQDKPPSLHGIKGCSPRVILQVQGMTKGMTGGMKKLSYNRKN